MDTHYTLDASLRAAGEALLQAAVRTCSTQWSAISTAVPTGRPARAIVDPEALLLASMALAKYEARLWRVCQIWARSGSRLLSVQRVKNLTGNVIATPEEYLAGFAWIAVTDGNDNRWHKLARREAPRSSRWEPPATPLVNHPAALTLRLRLGMGVGIKADVLCFLVGMVGVHATIQEIALATGYYGRAVRRAVEELAAARFVQSRSTSPASFRVDMNKWHQPLDFDLDDPPAWRSWAAGYGFVVAVLDWIRSELPDSETVAVSAARRLMTTHSEALAAAGMAPLPSGATGLEPFRRVLEEFARYLEAAV